MLQNDKIRIDEILFVNHLIGNSKGSHTKFRTDSCNHYQLLYKLKGEAVIAFGEKTVREQAGDVRFLPNPARFAQPPNYTADVVEEGESINIGFTSESVLPQEILVWRYRNPVRIEQLFRKMQKHWYVKHEGYEYQCLALLYEIFAVMREWESQNRSPEAYRQILPAVEYIDLHFTDVHIDCEKLAELCGISHTYLVKRFQNVFGMAPNPYIVSKKIRYACDLLNTEQYSVSEVAEKTGFSDIYYFSRVFRKMMGVAPSNYTGR